MEQLEVEYSALEKIKVLASLLAAINADGIGSSNSYKLKERIIIKIDTLLEEL